MTGGEERKNIDDLQIWEKHLLDKYKDGIWGQEKGR